MPELTPGMLKLTTYWGTIQSAVSQRASTADLWSAVKNAAAAEGFSIAGASGADMSRLRGIAAANRNAMETFSRSGAGLGITANMVGSELYARDPTTQALTPRFVVRFAHNVIENGAETTQWRASVFEGILPPTVGEMRAQLEIDGQFYAEDYDQTHVSIGDVAITAS